MGVECIGIDVDGGILEFNIDGQKVALPLVYEDYYYLDDREPPPKKETTGQLPDCLKHPYRMVASYYTPWLDGSKFHPCNCRRHLYIHMSDHGMRWLARRVMVVLLPESSLTPP